MRVSVVVVTADRPENVKARVRELGRASQLILMDDTGRTRRGAVRCLNIGIENAINDVVVLLGDDVSIPDSDGFFARLSWYFEAYRPQIVGFNVIDRYNDIRPNRVFKTAVWLLFGQSYPERGGSMLYGDGICTVCFAIDKSKVTKRFDEGFLGSGFNADWDFVYDQKVLYAPDLRAYHHVPRVPYSQVVRRNRRLMVHNRGVFLRKHFRFPRLRMVLYLGYLLLMPLGESLYRKRDRNRSTISTALRVPQTIPV